MVEIRVAVADATGVHGLVERLSDAFDRSCVSFDAACEEIKVRLQSETRGVVLALNAVEGWLAENGAGTAKLSIGDRTYTMNPQTCRPRVHVVCLPSKETMRHYTAELPPASGDVITLDHTGEQVRVVERHIDGNGGWIVYASPVADGEDVELDGLVGERLRLA